RILPSLLLSSPQSPSHHLRRQRSALTWQATSLSPYSPLDQQQMISLCEEILDGRQPWFSRCEIELDQARRIFTTNITTTPATLPATCSARDRSASCIY